MFNYNFPMASFTADIVVFKRDWVLDAYPGRNRFEISVLLIQRREDPYKHEWALPGGYVELDKETSEEAARRELFEETGLIITELNSIGWYDAVNRDPRGRVISHAFHTAFYTDPPVEVGDDAMDYKWIKINETKRHILAFDHKQIIIDACKKLGLEYSNDF